MRTHRAIRQPDRALGSGVQPPRQAIYDRRLLVVEDDTEIWPILERIGRLIDPRLQVDFATNALEALARVKSRQRYRAVLADILLPGSHDGYWLRPVCGHYQPWADFAMMSSTPLAYELDARFLPKPFTIRHAREFMVDLLSPGESSSSAR